MGWARLEKDVREPGDPVRDQSIRHLAEDIQKALEGRGKLDSVEIMVRLGRKGWRSTGLGLSPTPGTEDLDPWDASRELHKMAASHRDEEGGGSYQARVIGTNSRGTTDTLSKRILNLGDDESEPDDPDPNPADLMRASRQMVDALVSANSTLCANMGKMAAEVVGLLSVAKGQGESLVRMKELELAAERERSRGQQEAAEHERRWETIENVGRRYETEISEILRAWAGQMNAQAAAGPKPSGGIAGELTALLGELTDPQKDDLCAAIGEDEYALVVAASLANDDHEVKAILSKLAEIWKSKTRAEGTEIIHKVSAALGPRAIRLLDILRRAGVAR